MTVAPRRQQLELQPLPGQQEISELGLALVPEPELALQLQLQLELDLLSWRLLSWRLLSSFQLAP